MLTLSAMSTVDDSEELITGDEIAAEYKVTAASVRRWARAGILPVAAITPGGLRRYRRGDVNRVLRPDDAAS